jgi:arsenite methyltransferase
MEATTNQLDTHELESKIKDMYRSVALRPDGKYHFEMGREMAERLGYWPAVLDSVPAEAVESFAGVGYYFDLAGLRPGERVLDLGSGSGMDVFYAARQVGETGAVTGIDMTDEQLEKAERLRSRDGFEQILFVKSRIEQLPLEEGSFDVVVSNGVINLSPDKQAVFKQAARVLRPGGRMALADIVSERELAERTRCNTDLWAACIAGAIPRDDYAGAVEAAGLRIEELRENPGYHFISERAMEASDKYGVTSISLLAVKD